MVEHYISSDITPYKNLLTRFWPGPLTIVVTANENAMIDKRLFGENQKIGVRIPLYQPLQTIIEHAELPLVASSANRKGETPLSSTEQISATFKDVIDVLVFDDAYCPLGTASTVIDVSTSTMKVLREGVISIKALESVL
jgi:L-threonylcarbamoyladenylate synthase